MENNKAVKRMKTEDLVNHVTCSLGEHVVKDPHMLQCCHMYCKECLPQLLRADQSGYVCQICEIPTEEAKPSQVMNQLLTLYQQSQLPQKCCHCEAAISTVAYKCSDCQLFVCSEKCKQRHLRFPAFKTHQLVTYGNDTDEVIIQPVLYCEEHTNKSLELNCVDCSKLICMKCKLTKHERHQSQSTEEGIYAYLPEIQKLTEAVQEAECTIKTTKETTENKMDIFNNCVQEKLEELKLYKDKLREQIEGEYKEVKKTITHQQQQVNHYYEQIIKEERNKLTCVTRAQYLTRLIELHAEGECLLQTLQKELIPQMKQLCESFNGKESPMKTREHEEVIGYLVASKHYEPVVFLKDKFSIMRTDGENPVNHKASAVNPWHIVDLESLNTKFHSQVLKSGSTNYRQTAIRY